MVERKGGREGRQKGGGEVTRRKMKCLLCATLTPCASPPLPLPDHRDKAAHQDLLPLPFYLFPARFFTLPFSCSQSSTRDGLPACTPSFTPPHLPLMPLHTRSWPPFVNSLSLRRCVTPYAPAPTSLASYPFPSSLPLPPLPLPPQCHVRPAVLPKTGSATATARRRPAEQRLVPHLRPHLHLLPPLERTGVQTAHHHCVAGTQHSGAHPARALSSMGRGLSERAGHLPAARPNPRVAAALLLLLLHL